MLEWRWFHAGFRHQTFTRTGMDGGRLTAVGARPVCRSPAGCDEQHDGEHRQHHPVGRGRRPAEESNGEEPPAGWCRGRRGCRRSLERHRSGMKAAIERPTLVMAGTGATAPAKSTAGKHSMAGPARPGRGVHHRGGQQPEAERGYRVEGHRRPEDRAVAGGQAGIRSSAPSTPIMAASMSSRNGTSSATSTAGSAGPHPRSVLAPHDPSSVQIWSRP